MTGTRHKLDTAALTIAGSDSCGGAGIQADLRAFKAMSVHGASVITALTAQNTLGVEGVQPIGADMIAAQFNAVLDDLPIRAIKTGMLPDLAAIARVSEIFKRRCRGLSLVVDPVLVATSGSALTLEDTVKALCEDLFPLATLVTPNVREAEALTGLEVRNDQDSIRAAQQLLAYGCSAVLLKGGHASGDSLTDLLVTGDRVTAFEHPRQDVVAHGTGCALSAAIAALLARGEGLQEAVRSGIDYVQDAIGNSRMPLKGPLSLLP